MHQAQKYWAWGEYIEKPKSDIKRDKVWIYFRKKDIPRLKSWFRDDKLDKYKINR